MYAFSEALKYSQSVLVIILIPARSVLFVSYNFDCSIITEDTKHEETIFILMYLWQTWSFSQSLILNINPKKEYG